MNRLLIASALGLMLAPGLALAAKPAAPAPTAPAVSANPADWREIDPENVLVIDTSKGRIMVELMPIAAPNHVERVKKLAREHFYDGIKFHRVIDEFMDQTGDPQGTGSGGSSYPNLKAEFTFRRDEKTPFTGIISAGGHVDGFIDNFAVRSRPEEQMMITADHKVLAQGLLCPGAAAMARTDDPDGANSQFFLMRQHSPSEVRLPGDYTTWGRVVSGMDVVRSIKTGEPVKDPDIMTRVQVLADMPQGARPKVLMLDTRSAAFKSMVDKTRAARGEDFSVCDVDVPTQVK
jgi:peptidylprolyl isomerase